MHTTYFPHSSKPRTIVLSRKQNIFTDLSAIKNLFDEWSIKFGATKLIFANILVFLKQTVIYSILLSTLCRLIGQTMCDTIYKK